MSLLSLSAWGTVISPSFFLRPLGSVLSRLSASLSPALLLVPCHLPAVRVSVHTVPGASTQPYSYPVIARLIHFPLWGLQGAETSQTLPRGWIPPDPKSALAPTLPPKETATATSRAGLHSAPHSPLSWHPNHQETLWTLTAEHPDSCHLDQGTPSPLPVPRPWHTAFHCPNESLHAAMKAQSNPSQVVSLRSSPRPALPSPSFHELPKAPLLARPRSYTAPARTFSVQDVLPPGRLCLTVPSAWDIVLQDPCVIMNRHHQAPL